MTAENQETLELLLAELLEPVLRAGKSAREIHRDLAKRVNRKAETIKNWRTGKSTPSNSLETQLTLLKALVDLDYIPGPSDDWVERYLALFGLPSSPELIRVVRTSNLDELKIAFTMTVSGLVVRQATFDVIEGQNDGDLYKSEGGSQKRRWTWTAVTMAGLLFLVLALVLIRLRGRAHSNPTTQVTFCDGSNEMVFVAPGEFIMGSTMAEVESFAEACPSKVEDPSCGAEYFTDEIPQRTVMQSPFCVDQYEVTNAQYQQFVDATEYVTTAEQRGTSATWLDNDRDWSILSGADWRHPNGPDTSIDGLDSHPVVQVSLADARAYCEWRDKRLPSDAEWEKATRGTDGRLRPWGDEWDPSRLNYYGVKPPGTRPVGSYPEGASPYGAHDMLGNVMEWVEVDSGAERRGGSWASIEVYLHAAWRNYEAPDDTRPTVGFRCAKDVAVPTE